MKNINSCKIIRNIITIVILSICLCITTFAILLNELSIGNNLFNTGKVKINLNNGKPIFSDTDLQFSPGMTLEKNFSVQNESSCDVYYKLYFQNVHGGLENILKITIYDGSNVLFTGTALELGDKKNNYAQGFLTNKEDKNLKISLYFPTNIDNTYMNKELDFDVCADAVQTNNNPQKLFD